MTLVHLLPLGGADPRLVSALAGPIALIFHVPVLLGTAPVDPRRFQDHARGQVDSSRLLLALKAHAPSNGGVVVGVTAEDLFIPVLTSVFGDAEIGGNVAVVSYERLLPERYGLPRDPRLLEARLLREVLHELGHTCGLPHCREQTCVMHAATDVEDIDLRGETFCDACHRTLAARLPRRGP